MRSICEVSPMADEKRILSKISELDGYLRELEEVRPSGFREYESSVEKRRSCERLLQISIECVVDVCSLLVKGLSAGLPSDEDDLFVKLGGKRVFSKSLVGKLRQMKSFRNILVHRYGTVDDRLVFKFIEEDSSDLREFISQTLKALKNLKKIGGRGRRR
ncbi:MAG: DUF86 domain-containing protein [Candidatus Altiarchaeota archaeon]